MITIPIELIDRADLSITQRAIIPYIIRHTFIWGAKPLSIDIPTISKDLHLATAQTIEALEDLVKKNILVKSRKKTALGMVQHYSMAAIEDIKESSTSYISLEYNDKSNYLNLPQDKKNELEIFAKEWCVDNGVSLDVLVEFELYQKTQNKSSFDWFAEFELFARKYKNKNTAMTLTNDELSSLKPSMAEFDMAKYFISKLKAIDPQFKEPLDIQSWGLDIKHLIDIDGYSLLDIKNVIDWLFSAKGDWFRPNVMDTKSLRKHFVRLISHTRSFRDARVKLPDGINLFDLYDQIDE